jgi:hypothetical protein
LIFKLEKIFIFKKKYDDNKKKINAVIWAFAQIALYLKLGNKKIREEIIKASLLDKDLNLIFKHK